MKTEIEIINGEEYEIKTLNSGHVIKELKMTESQKAQMKASAEAAKAAEAAKPTIESLMAAIEALSKKVDEIKEWVIPK